MELQEIQAEIAAIEGRKGSLETAAEQQEWYRSPDGCCWASGEPSEGQRAHHCRQPVPAVQR